MALDPWYKVVTLRKEVREGRSFSPDESAIAMEQVVATLSRKENRLLDAMLWWYRGDLWLIPFYAG